MTVTGGPAAAGDRCDAVCAPLIEPDSRAPRFVRRSGKSVDGFAENRLSEFRKLPRPSQEHFPLPIQCVAKLQAAGIMSMNRHASMNRFYRLIWSNVLRAFVPVPECARGRSKGSRRARSAATDRSAPMNRDAPMIRGATRECFGVVLGVACLAPVALSQTLPQGSVISAQGQASLPQGANVRAGGATITSSATQMDITTTGTRTAIDWTSFSIAAGNTVDIQQPSSSSITLNRVTGVDPSQVFGDLISNGQVVLANANGIWFGPQAHVDVAAIVATASRPSDGSVAAFGAGGSLNLGTSQSGSSIVNEGAITVADGGLAGLVAPAVRNAGVITARLGQVTLASGAATTVDFYGDRLINLVVGGQAKAPSTAVDGSSVAAGIDNSGKILADGGSVRLSANVAAGILNDVIDMSGVIEARGVSTAGGTVELFGGSGSVAVSGTIDVSGQGPHPGGAITIQAGSPAAAADGIADIGGSLDAASAGGVGGTVSVSGRIVTPSGTISVDGAAGGSVAINAGTLIQSGAISADAASGTAGRIDLSASDNIVQTSYATTSADSAGGRGGSVMLDGGPNGRVFSSGSVTAKGTIGGDIDLLGNSIGLAAASIDADGGSQGGTILVGGGLHGKGEPTAATTEVNPATTLSADALAGGEGGTVVVWSDAKTVFEGSASARGGAAGGNGGLIEVSSGNDLAFTGTGDAGAAHGNAGTLLLDPKNIVIDGDAGNVAQFNLIDPDAGIGSGFGTQIVQLSNGTVLVTKPGDNVGGSAGAGSIFYFNPTSGALLATFQGSHAGDAVGSLGVTFLNYANWYDYYIAYSTPTLINDTTKAYVISSPSWNGGAGAITWVAADSTVSGVLSSSNSLVGASAGDAIGTVNGGNNLYLLPNDNYLVLSPNWSNGKGAVTFGTAGSALTGVVSSANSLVGSTATYSGAWNTLSGDNVGGGGVVLLSNDNFVVTSPNWNMQAGAVSFGTEAAGLPTGVLGSTNSLVGATGAEIYVGTNTLNGNSHFNAYYGGDQVGNSYEVYALANGNYVVASPDWGHDKGALTVGSGTTGITGTVSTANSLTGSNPGVGTGGSGIGNYNGSTYYTDAYGYRYDYGGDQLGSGGVVQLSNGNLVISSPGWNKGDGAVTFLPASTTALGTSGSLASVTSGNSLVGSHQSSAYWDGQHDVDFTGGDYVGYVTGLTNGNYVVASNDWDGTLGAVTLMNGANGHAAVGSSGSTGDTVSASNSLTGSYVGDYIGQITPLSGSSNFVVSSTTWNGGRGAVTRVDGSTGIAGAVSASNSLVGTTGYQTPNDLGGDQIGGTIVPLANGNWVIESPNWSMTKGAVTLVAAGATPTGNLSSANSLVGSTAGSIYCSTCNDGEAAIFGGDAVGSGGIAILPNNNFLVLSPSWNVNRGAATFVNGATGALVDGTPSLTGTISSTNSLVGGNAGTVKISAYDDYGYSQVGMRYYVGGDQVGANDVVTILPNGNIVLNIPLWNDQTGAVTMGTSTGTFVNGAAFAGTVSSANSLVGTTAGIPTAPANPTTANWTVVGGDQAGSAGVQLLSNNNFLVLSPLWNGAAGAVTWASGGAALSGVISSANSLVGSNAGDMVGSNAGISDVTVLPNGNYLIPSPGWNGGIGAVTFGTPSAAVVGVVSSSNSLVGGSAGDAVGSGGVTALPNGDYVINSPSWNGGTGAATWSQGSGAVTGVISSANSLLGAVAGNNSLGSFASIDPKAFFVSMPADNGGEGGVVYAGTDPTVWDFARAQANTVTIAPSLILASLDAGTSIVLQASNDITVNSALIATPGATGNLTLDAGRSVLVHADINTGNGDLTIVANDTAGDGVVDAQRSAGTAVITVDDGASLSTGSGALSIELAASTDKTYNAAGNIVLGALNGASVSVANLGSAGGDLTLNGVVTASGGGNSLVLATGGDFVNDAGANALNPGAGRYLVYSASPLTNTLDGLSDTTHFFGQTYGLNGPGTQAATGNEYLYSVVPVLTVTSNGSAGYGTPASGLTAQVSGFIDGDTLSTAVSGAAALSTSYVAGDAVGGSYPITVSRGSLSSPLGYAFAFENGDVTVTREALSIELTGLVSKTYDGTATATLGSGNYELLGLYGSDTISVTQTAGLYATANAGTGISVGASLSGANFSPGNGTLLSNYTLPTGFVSGSVGAITKAPLTASLVGTVSKTYDGGLAAPLTDGNYSLSGVIAGQSIDVVGTTPGSYASANVGSAITVDGTLTAGNFSAGNGTSLANYTLPVSAAGAVGSITPAPLSVALGGTVSKVYDGGESASLTAVNYVVGGLVGGQSIGVTQSSGTYASANVGSGLSVSALLTSGDFSAANGTALTNYSLPTGTVSGAIGAITPAPLMVSLSGAVSKPYDGGEAANLAGASYTLHGVVNGQSIGVTGPSIGSYASANVGTGIGVNATLSGGNFSAGTGTLLGNYALPTAASGAIGTITPAPLTASLTGTTSKVYDGGDTAGLTSVNFLLAGLVEGQSISVSGTSGSYASPNVGTGIGVSATLTNGMFSAGTGTLLSNYTLPTAAAGAIGAITPAPLTVVLGGTAGKVYDGSATATLTPANYLIEGLVGGQSISVNETSGSYASTNVGSGIPVSVLLTNGNFSAGTGTSLGNYALPTGTLEGAIGAITPAPLTVVLGGTAGKVYDGSATATLTPANYLIEGLVGGQSIGVTQSSGTYASANVGSGLPVSALLTSGDFSAANGTALTNYSLPTGTVSGAIGAITPAPLTVVLGGTAGKVYDGSATATLTPANYLIEGLVGGQSIGVTQSSGTYASANVGSGIPVSVLLTNGNFSAGTGTSLGNYALPTGTLEGAIGAITPAPLTVVLGGTAGKVYDGGATATLTPANYLIEGLVGGQSISVNETSGSYASTNVGSGIPVSVLLTNGNFSAGTGTSLGNYALPTGTLEGAIGAITPAPLSVSLVPGSVSRTYDGGSSAPIGSADYRVSGLVPGQSLSVAPTTGNYASDNVGTGIAVTTSLSSGDFVAGPGTQLGNYALPIETLSGNAGIITPAPLVITANSASKPVGAPNPALTVSYSGFVDGQGAANLAVQPTVTTSASTGSAAGTYAIEVAGAVDPNYAITYVDGVMKVAQTQVRDNISNIIENSVAGNIDAQTRLSSAIDGDLFLIGQSQSYLPAQSGAPAEQAATARQTAPIGSAAPAARLGVRSPDRDAHSYANAYLASIGLGVSK